MQVCSLAVRFLFVVAQQVRFFEASLTDGASYHFENQVAVSYLNKRYPNQASSAARFLKPDRKTQATGNGSVALETFADFP